MIIKDHDDQALIKRIWDKLECPIDKHSFAPSHSPKKRGVPKPYHLFEFVMVFVRESRVEVHEKKRGIFDFCNCFRLDCSEDIVPIEVCPTISNFINYFLVYQLRRSLGDS